MDYFDKYTNTISVEEVKGFFDLLFLLFSEFISSLSSGLERGFFLFESAHS
jgi:hypothetical protein